MNDMAIRVSHAVQNNLKDISVEIPFGQLVCITGVSGSGKSTFVEHCIGEIAQHRHLALSGKNLPHLYKETSFSAEVPFVSLIKQGVLATSDRSVVGTALGIIQKLREIIVPCAEIRDVQGRVIGPLNAHTLVQWCQQQHPEARLSLAVCLEHMVLGAASRHIKPALAIFPECRIQVTDAETPYEYGDVQTAEKYLGSVFRKHKDIYAVLPDLSACHGGQLGAAFDSATESYPGHDLILVVENQSQIEVINLAHALLRPRELQVYCKPSETLLSFNSHSQISGQCPVCKGIGRQISILREAVFLENEMPITGGGLGLIFNQKTDEYLYFPALCDEIRGVLSTKGEKLNATWEQLQFATQEILTMGSAEAFQPLNVEGKEKGKRKPFSGITQRIQGKLNGSSGAAQGLHHLRHEHACSACGGTRLNQAARAVYFAGRSYPELINLTLFEMQDWLHGLLEKKAFQAADSVISALLKVCRSCVDVGLGHLQLSRATNTLSGGEGQRLRIARDLWARLDHACYVIDEPTRGLHTQDVLGVFRALDKLRTPQNCVLLVEHNPALVSHADRVIELGPQGGAGGGEVLYDGPPAGCSLLDNFLAPSLLAEIGESTGWIVVKKANLRIVLDQSFRLPLGQMTCFTGVSGSGKTTVVAGVLLPALELLQNGLGRVVSQTGEVVCEGVESFRLVYLSQSPLGGSYRSRVLTHLGLGDLFRDWFCETSGAVGSGVTASHFSSNTLEGQCATCEGRGRVRQGAANDEVCPSCCGSGFNPEAGFFRAHEWSITEWMDCSFSELGHRQELPAIICYAAARAEELGLGHLTLGRPVPSLSGGECQRLRIVKALLDAGGHRNTEVQQHLVVVMDEPSAGLHRRDVQHLIMALKNNITDKGHTLLLIEHNLQLTGHADWIVDIGPGSAAQGGKVMFSGSLGDFLQSGLKVSPTYLALKGLLASEFHHAPHYAQLLTHPSGVLAQQESVARFRQYLQGKSEDLDNDVVMNQVVAPAYSFEASTLSSRTFARTTQLDTGLFQMFAAESGCTRHPIMPSIEELKNQALDLLQAGWRIGWFPSPAGYEVATWSDVVENIKTHIKCREGIWFDGQRICAKPPYVRQSLKLDSLRLLLSSNLAPAEAVNQALALGKGWVSLVCVETGEVRDLSMRAIDYKKLRLGARWQIPQIFDAAAPLHACPLCHGKGFIESVDQNLIFKDKRKPLDSDDLFHPYALEVLKLDRRQVLLPAARWLKESALTDLTVPLNIMEPEVAAAFWFGYPYKAFLKKGGRKHVTGDWVCWRGINQSVLLNMWKCSSRQWAEKVNVSRSAILCPECECSGLGWEARQRVLAGVSMQDIYLHYTARQLQLWLRQLHLKTGKGRKIQQALGLLIDHMIETVGCDFRLFEQLIHLPERVQMAALCRYLHHNALINTTIYLHAPAGLTDSQIKEMIGKSAVSALMKLVLV
ncbi:excinuclease ABC subunit UvrA [Ferrovum myxofaciens]|uniref:hypothetical protein n=1 Tax=Ferrovum myxofaciens TaxID=416213 RepID=UPI00123757C2|nr:hypothetical protein [Ferrovum myxofaciens]